MLRNLMISARPCYIDGVDNYLSYPVTGLLLLIT